MCSAISTVPLIPILSLAIFLQHQKLVWWLGVCCSNCFFGGDIITLSLSVVVFRGVLGYERNLFWLCTLLSCHLFGHRYILWFILVGLFLKSTCLEEAALSVLCFIKFMLEGHAWWYTPLILSLRSGRNADLWVQGQPGLSPHFHSSQSYIARPCFYKKKKDLW